MGSVEVGTRHCDEESNLQKVPAGGIRPSMACSQGERRSGFATSLHGRLVAGLVLAAVVALGTLGALHAAEHGARHETTSCGICVAVTAHGLVAEGLSTLDVWPEPGIRLAWVHVDPSLACRFNRPSARAPPALRA